MAEKYLTPESTQGDTPQVETNKHEVRPSRTETGYCMCGRPLDHEIHNKEEATPPSEARSKEEELSPEETNDWRKKRIELAKEFVRFIKETDNDVGLEIITYGLMDKVESIVINNYSHIDALNKEDAPDCLICNDKGWYFVNEWIGSLQGRRDCKCKKKQQFKK